MGTPRNTTTIAVGREIFDYLLMGLAVLLFLNIVVALVFLDSNQEGYLGIRKEGFRMAACWVLLMTLCLAADHLRNYRLAVLILSVLLGLGVQYTSLASARAQGAQNTRFELMMSVFAIYFALPTFMVLLVSTKVDNLSSELEKEKFRQDKLQAEGSKLLEMLKKSREKREDVSAQEDDATIERRRLALELTADMYEKMMRIKFRRDINNLLEELFAVKLGFDQGFVLEAPEEGREMKVKNTWGFHVPAEQADKLIEEHKDRELSMWVFDKREWLDRDKLRKIPVLAEAHDRFAAKLFTVEHVIPVASLNKTQILVFLSKQRPDVSLPFDASLVEPFVASMGQVLAKISGKSVKPQFAAFG